MKREAPTRARGLRGLAGFLVLGYCYLMGVRMKADRLFPKMGECREVLGGGPAPPSKL